MKDEGSGKQVVWKHFSTKRIGNESSKIVELSQGWTPNVLKIRLDRYQPKATDKQYYTWLEEGVEQQYHTPAYGVANLDVARSAIENFLWENAEGYIDAHLKDASEITRMTFRTAQENKVCLPFSRTILLPARIKHSRDGHSISHLSNAPSSSG